MEKRESSLMAQSNRVFLSILFVFLVYFIQFSHSAPVSNLLNPSHFKPFSFLPTQALEKRFFQSVSMASHHFIRQSSF